MKAALKCEDDKATTQLPCVAFVLYTVKVVKVKRHQDNPCSSQVCQDLGHHLGNLCVRVLRKFQNRPIFRVSNK